MAYQCIPLTTKEYKATLAELMKTPAKAKKFNNFSDKYKSITKAINALEKLESDKYLSAIILELKQEQASCQVVSRKFRTFYCSLFNGHG